MKISVKVFIISVFNIIIFNIILFKNKTQTVVLLLLKLGDDKNVALCSCNTDAIHTNLAIKGFFFLLIYINYKIVLHKIIKKYSYL